MGREYLAPLLAVGLVAASLATSASAQVVRARNVDDMISRPTDRSASQRIGGRFTGAEQNLMRSPQRNVNLLGRSSETFMRPPGGRSLGRSLPSAVSQLRSPLTTGGVPPWARSTWQQSARISGLSQSMLLTRPLPGSHTLSLPALDAYTFTPRHDSDRFHEFFGLKPSGPQLDPNQVPVASIAEQMARRTEARVDSTAEQALELFRKATVERRNPRTGRYPNCRDCADNLAESSRLFRLVRNLDDERYLPSLLMAHAALDQDQPSLATVYLLDAFARDPESFLASARELHTYFGDTAQDADAVTSQVLEAQLRRYSRIGDLNEDEVDAQVLAAYCAWQLDDPGRARESLQRATRLVYEAGGIEGSERLLRFVTALEQQLAQP